VIQSESLHFSNLELLKDNEEIPESQAHLYVSVVSVQIGDISEIKRCFTEVYGL
jgi:hypothetical protein